MNSLNSTVETHAIMLPAEAPVSNPMSPLPPSSARARGRRASTSCLCGQSPLSGRVNSAALQSQLNKSGAPSTSNINTVANNMLVPANAQENCPTRTSCDTQPQAHNATVQIAMTGCKRPLEKDTCTAISAELQCTADASTLRPLPVEELASVKASAPLANGHSESATVHWRRRPASAQKLAKIAAGMGLVSGSAASISHSRRLAASPQTLDQIVAEMELGSESFRVPKPSALRVTFKQQCLSTDIASRPAHTQPSTHHVMLDTSVEIQDAAQQDSAAFDPGQAGLWKILWENPNIKRTARAKKAKKAKAKRRKATCEKVEAMEEHAQEFHWDGGAAFALFSMARPLARTPKTVPAY